MSLRVYPDRVVVAAEGMVICEHSRIIDRSHDQPGKTVYDWRHYLAVVQRKPGALRNGAPFKDCFTDPAEVVDGHFVLPQLPGAGTTPTEAAWQQYRQATG